MFKWCKLSCKTIGFILAGVGAAVIILTVVPVWLIVGLLGLALIIFGVLMIF